MRGLFLASCVVASLRVAAADPADQPLKPAPADHAKRPRFDKPSQIAPGKHVVDGTPAQPAAPADADQPLRPIERDARATRPHFARPSEIEGGAVAVSATAAPAVAPAAVGPESNFAIPRTYSYVSGYWRDWTGETLLQRPSAASDSAGKPRRATLFVRGFYTALDRGLGDWSGAELLGSVDVTDRVALSAALRHELRDSVGNQAVISASTLLTRDVALLTTFGAGNGADYMPVTLLEAEARVRVTKGQPLQYLFGGGASWWSESRRMFHIDAGGIFTYSDTLSGEYRVQLYRVDSDDATARIFPRLTLTLLEGHDGKTMFQERITGGRAPLYGPDVDLAMLPYAFSVNVEVGLRRWIAPHYGYIIGIDSGAQAGGYLMLGADVAVFVQP